MAEATYTPGCVHGTWLILSQGMSRHHWHCRCTICGTARELGNDALARLAPRSCQMCEARRPPTRFGVGAVHGTWLVIGRGTSSELALCRCRVCGHEREIHKNVLAETKAKFSCPGCCPRCRGKYSVGTVHNGLEVIQHLGRNDRLCRCLKCGVEDRTTTASLRLGRSCKACRRRRMSVGEAGKYALGTIHNGLEVIGYLDAKRRQCRCRTCGHERPHSVSSLFFGVTCKRCRPRKSRGRKPRKTRETGGC